MTQSATGKLLKLKKYIFPTLLILFIDFSVETDIGDENRHWITDTDNALNFETNDLYVMEGIMMIKCSS